MSGLVRGVLLDTTRGEQTPWVAGDLRSSAVAVSVDAVSSSRLRLHLEGELALGDGQRTYAPHLDGMITVDRQAGRITACDLLVLGTWQQGQLDPPAPAGAELGIHITLAPTSGPVVHPHIAREGLSPPPP